MRPEGTSCVAAGGARTAPVYFAAICVVFVTAAGITTCHAYSSPCESLIGCRNTPHGVRYVTRVVRRSVRGRLGSRGPPRRRPG